MNRSEVTEAIVAARLAKGLKWADIAKEVGKSKEWTTAALLRTNGAHPETGRSRWKAPRPQ
jgi:cyanate lyase